MAERSHGDAPEGGDDRTVVAGAELGGRPVPPSATRSQPTGPATADVTALPVGTHLFEFEITGVIGEGGFGIVYSAQDHSLDRPVAIKEYMPTAFAGRTGSYAVSVRSQRHAETFQAGLRSFINEAKLLAHFDHPSLLKVFRFWEANGTAYMAMPLYRGMTLKDRLKQMGEPPSEAWLRALLAPMLEALEVLHRENCFHRDIAPDNILLLDDDRPVLLDFGAARRVIGDATHDLTVILKPGYAPVEQYAEVPGMKQGPWTDLYALGAVVYFAVTGRAPEPSVGRMMSDGMAPLANLGRGRYSDAFLAAFDAALRVRPQERPQDVAALRALLELPAPGNENASAGAAATTRSSATQSAAREVRPSASFVSGGLILLAVVALAGAGSYAYRHFIGASSENAPAPIAIVPKPEPKEIPPAAPERAMAPGPEQVAPPTTEGAMPTGAQSPQATPEPDPHRAPPQPPPVPKPEKKRVPPDGPKREVTKAPDQAVEKQPSLAKPSVPTAQEKVQTLLAQGREALSRKDWRRASEHAKDALALDPTNREANDILFRAGQGDVFERTKIE